MPDVVVIGGGVMGLATAWRLALAGTDVVLLERFDTGHANGSSHGPTRVFRYLYHDPLYVRMAQAALPLWRELGADLVRMTGGLHVDDPAILALHRDAMESCGATTEPLTPDEMRERFGWFALGDTPAMWVPDVGVIAAANAIGALQALAPDVRNGVAVEAIDVSDDGVVLSTSSGPVRARRCVVAAGAWAPELLGPLGIDLPVKITREQVFYFTGDTDGMVPFVHGIGHWMYAVPDAERVKVAEHGTGAVTTADERSFDVDEAGAERVRDYVKRFLPRLDPEPVGFETCLYTTTPDEDFVIDLRGPVVVVSPCSGHGFKFAPLIGEIAACLATDRRPPVEIDRFSLARF